MSERRFPWRTLLAFSAGLNLLLIGAGVGAYSAGVRVHRQADEAAVVERIPGPRAFLAALPEETRPLVRERLVSGWAQSREVRRAAAEARRAAFAVAAEEPFDVARVSAAFARVRAADQQAVGVFHDNVVQAFAEMTPEQRRAALATMRRAPPAAREAGVAPPAPGEGEAARGLQERREMMRERRERWRERRRARQEGAP